jgi:hypothetical protein
MKISKPSSASRIRRTVAAFGSMSVPLTGVPADIAASNGRFKPFTAVDRTAESAAGSAHVLAL